ncbi:MAG: hypothetical protein WD646_14215 [Actinomycetota bacterium]
MKARKFFAGLFVLLLASPIVLAADVSAKERIVREAVVSTLAPDGAVERTTVAQLLHLEAPEGGSVELRVPKLGDLDSYRNLSGFRGPAGDADDFVWRTEDRLDTRALARFSGKLPVEVRVHYFLDGREMDASEIKRRRGDVRIEIELVNVSGEPKSLEHKAVTSPFMTSVVNQYVPIEYVVRVEFPTSRWNKVGGEGIKVATDGDREIASASGILSPPLTDADKTVVFEAHSDDVLTPRVQVFAVPSLSQEFVDALQAQFEALQALYDGVGGVGENLAALYDGTVQLVDGVELLLGGIGERDPVTGKPVIDLDDDGDPTTVLGGLGAILAGITGDILPNLGERDPETGEGVIVTDEKGIATTFLGSLQSQKNAYDDELIPGLGQVIDGIDQISDGLDEGGAALIDGLEQVIGGIDLISSELSSGGPLLIGGLDQIADGVAELLANLQTNNPGDPGFREGLLGIQGGLSDLLASLQTNDPMNPGIREGLLGVQGGLSTLLGNLQTNNPGDPGFREGLLGLQQVAASAATTFLGDPSEAVFTTIAGGLGQLVASLGDIANPPNDTTIIGAIETMSAGMAQLVAGLGNTADAPTDTTVIGGVELLSAGMAQLLAGLGNTADVPTDATIIGALQLMYGGLTTLALPGANDLVDGVLGGLAQLRDPLAAQIVPGMNTLVDTVLGGLDQLRGGLTNPNFTKKQDELGGRTPKEYYQECPGCFDPDHEAFDPATASAEFQPRLLEALNLFSEGIEAALPQLDSFDDDNPGLIDGLQQIADGLDTLASKLHTLDPDDPGVVEGLATVRGGLQQVNQGVFAVNELGIRTMRGQLGDEGDAIGRTQTTLTDKASKVDSVLEADADVVSATYVYDIPAQSTAGNDNARRGAVMALALAGSVFVTRRIRRVEI